MEYMPAAVDMGDESCSRRPCLLVPALATQTPLALTVEGAWGTCRKGREITLGFSGRYASTSGGLERRIMFLTLSRLAQC